MMTMRQSMISVLAGLAMAFSFASAGAQVPTDAPAAPPTHRINLTVAQRHVFKEIILKDSKFRGETQANAPGQVGDTVPPGVLLHPIPVDVSAKVPQVRTHLFFVKDNHVIVVDPKDNKVVEVVD